MDKAPALQSYGIKLGFKELSKLRISSSLKHLLLPVNYWRTLEFSLVLAHGNFEPSDVVLDIGSPKLLALYISKKLGSKVYATDIENYFIHEYELLRELENIPEDQLILQTEDGRNLSYTDQFFDKIFSISVLEHIPDEGDLQCAAEIGRVLKEGGQCLITVPFAKQSEMVYTSSTFYWAGSSKKREDGKVFFQRRYSEQDLYNRLIIPSGLKLKTIQYFGEQVLKNSKKELSEYLPKVSGPIQPLLSKWFHTHGASSWQELDKPLCAFMVLEKERS